jgi:DNA-binding NarL/FixJ family response regulator
METLQLLIVDDSSLMRDIIKDTIDDAFPNVHTSVANNGEQAQKMLSHGHFDIVLCDWEMPAPNGSELLKWLREGSTHQKVPFIMITAKDDKEHILEAMQLGVSGYIVKPFTPDIICQKVKPLLKKIGWIEPYGAGFIK